MANNNYAEAISAMMEESNMRFNEVEKEDCTIFSIPMHSENAPCFDVKLRVSENGDAKIWCYIASNIKPEKKIAVLETLNTLNNKYRFAKFAIDEENDVCTDYDFILSDLDEEVAANKAISMIYTMTDIMDNSIEPIMCIIWNKDTKRSFSDEVDRS